jgi:hypothetical protein
MNFIFFPVVNEGGRVAAERIFDKPSELVHCHRLPASKEIYRFPAQQTCTVLWMLMITSCLQYVSFAKTLKPADIINFIFFPVVNEGCRVVAEGVVDKPSDLDVASVMAMGFPAPRGGLIFWGDLVGAVNICSSLDKWAAALPPHAGFFRPCEYLRQCSSSGRKLSDGVQASRSRL